MTEESEKERPSGRYNFLDGNPVAALRREQLKYAYRNRRDTRRSAPTGSCLGITSPRSSQSPWPSHRVTASKSPTATAAGGRINEVLMSAEQGWIGEPQPTLQWHDSHYSRMADRIAEAQQDDQSVALQTIFRLPLTSPADAILDGEHFDA